MRVSQKRLALVQLTLFGSWILTLLVVLAVALTKFTHHEHAFTESREAFEKVAALLTPQLAVMATFFFRVSNEKQRILLEHAGPYPVIVAIAASIVYHTVLWFCVIYGIGVDGFGKGIDENASITIWIMGVLSVLGSVPVVQLFTTDIARRR